MTLTNNMVANFAYIAYMFMFHGF